MNIYYESLVNKSKSEYYRKLIRASENTSKIMWSVINKERGKNNAPHVDFVDLVRKPDGTKFCCKRAVVNAMNSRFVSAAAACGAPRADVQRARAGSLFAACAPPDRSLRLRRFTADEVYRIVVTRIPPKVSKDAYEISMRIIRAAIIPLAPVLAELYNSCLREGVCPDELKLSKVSPLYKGKGKREAVDSYRPVSIIPAVAKILENGLSSRLVGFLSETNALSDRQYAYREGYSTTSLTREVVRRIVKARDSVPKQQVALLCCDLSKAFEVADWSVLAAKLRHYGVNGASHALLTGLLQNRSQIVVGSGGSQRSDPLNTTMGVAQGSSVSNVLFSLLFNDLPSAVTSADVLMYADDVAGIVTAASNDILERKLNETASQLLSWFHINGLALNLAKTHFIQFSLSGRSLRPLTVLVDGVSIEEQKVTTFLGFQIDRGLKWDVHIDGLCAKLGSACFALSRVARVVPREVARSCYFATVHSLLQYGTELWGRAADWKRAFIFQKRAVRCVARVAWDTPARPHFQELGVMTLPAILIYQVAVYTRVHLAEYTELASKHKYCTRHGLTLANVPRGLQKSAKLTHVMGPTVYNKLPSEITAAISLQGFKFKLKSWLVDQAFYNVEEFIPDIR